MTSKRDAFAAGLLPSYFKKIGLGLITLTIISLIVIKLTGLALSPALLTITPTITLNLMIAGLLIVALTRDKEEDEMTISLRWKAMVWCFISASVYVIIAPLANLLIGQATTILSAQQIILFMLIGFLIMYTYFKKTR